MKLLEWNTRSEMCSKILVLKHLYDIDFFDIDNYNEIMDICTLLLIRQNFSRVIIMSMAPNKWQ